MTEEPQRRISRINLEEVRRKVVAAVNAGVHPEDAAKSHGVGRSTVFGWLRMAQDGGFEALAVKKSGGSAPKLSQKQLDQLVRWLIGSDPRQLQFDFALWTRDMIRLLIEREFAVTYTPQGVGQLLRRLGFSPQRPLVRAYEQDPDRVEAWRSQEYPKIRKLAAEQGATILFGDEAGVRTDYHSGTTWAPIGHTPVVKGTGQRVSVNMISAVTPRGQLYFSSLDGAGNSANFITFMESLLHDIDGKIFLIVDGHSSHTSKATRAFAEKNKERLTLFILPPYSPMLKPRRMGLEEHQTRQRRPRRRPYHRRDARRHHQAVDRMHATPSIILGFFRDPDLAYIGS